MTREEILQLYLDDKEIQELGYLSKNELINISWTNDKDHALVKALKSLIESSLHKETETMAVKKAKIKIDSSI